jgi:hypothetical protein
VVVGLVPAPPFGFVVVVSLVTTVVVGALFGLVVGVE